MADSEIGSFSLHKVTFDDFHEMEKKIKDDAYPNYQKLGRISIRRGYMR